MFVLCSYCSGSQVPQLAVPLSQEVNYLGVYLDSLSNNRRNTSRKVAQAVSASKLLHPLLCHPGLPPSRKLTVCQSIVQSIPLYAMDNAQLSLSQLTRLDGVHFKSIRQICKVKSALIMGSLILLLGTAPASILLRAIELLLPNTIGLPISPYTPWT